MKVRENFGWKYPRSGGTSSRSDPPIRVMGNLGAIVKERPHVAAFAIVRGEARAINEKGDVIRPTVVILCPIAFQPFSVSKPKRLGTPVEAIDPGPQHRVLVLPWSTEDASLVPKEHARPVGKCRATSENCKSCPNKKKH